MGQPLSDWMRQLADKVERGEEINPCPKALRRVAEAIDLWVPYPAASSASTKHQGTPTP